MTLLLAVVLGVLVGLTLGALGGGGSILTVPALVYVLDEPVRSSTTASLVIVGITAAAGMISHARTRQVRWRTGLAFAAVGLPSSLGGTHLNSRTDPDVILICFAALMLIAAGALLAKTSVDSHEHVSPPPGLAQVSTRRTVAAVLGTGAVVGFLTGLLGVGGGFVMVPALALALQYEMPTAVGTSLLVISLNSGVALLARGGDESFHWAVIAPFTLAAVAGSVVGGRVADRVSSSHLTRAFAVLLVLVACYVALRVVLAGG